MVDSINNDNNRGAVQGSGTSLDKETGKQKQLR